jgi:hypothetical protein
MGMQALLSPKGARILLTIRAMTKMGPWMLTHIDHLDSRSEQCQICDTPIRNVWVMEKQTEPKEVWRIGSDCGPKLEQMSEELWSLCIRPFERCLEHLRTLQRIEDCERDYPHLRPAGISPGWVDSRRTKIARGPTKREQLVIGSEISRAEQRYRRSIAQCVQAIASTVQP